MKYLSLVAAICFLTFACKKDADPTPQELLVGTWKVSEFIVDNKNLVRETASSRITYELEFKASDEVVFTSIYTDLTATPNTEKRTSTSNKYVLNGDQLTFTGKKGATDVSASGPATITETTLLFETTSGDSTTYVQKIVAKKL